MIWLLIGIAVVLLYWYSTKNYDYWALRGVPYEKPWPIFGNLIRSSLGLMPPTDEIKQIYKKNRHHRFFGMFSFQHPVLTVNDPDLIKLITVKDFDHFLDHTNIFIKKDVDTLFSKNLFSLTGKHWKDMRSTLSPAFTSAKMKMMFEFVSECGKQLAVHYKRECDKSGTKQMNVELKDMFTRFANDVIATCAFGIKCDSFGDQTNEFYRMGKRVTSFSTFRLLMTNLVPFIMKLLGIGITETVVQNFFRNLIGDTLRVREEKGIIRPDMIHLLMEARKGRLKHEEESKQANEAGFAAFKESSVDLEKHKHMTLTDEDITAQALIFFIAGFDTASTLLAFVGYELAVNEDVQRKLQKEIDDTLEECNGEITYDALSKMKYMDMVVSEGLRKWPPAINTDRVCTQEYILKTPESQIKIEKGVFVMLPIHALQRDPKYFPDPEVFDPERFNDENKGKINNFAYIPFGVGPRGCIGSRFGLMEAKVSLFYLLSKFDIIVGNKTEIPLKLVNSPFRCTAKNGFWVDIKPRNIEN